MTAHPNQENKLPEAISDVQNSATLTEQDFDGITFEVEEDEPAEDGRTIKSRGVYLIPNLVTTIAFTCGFYSILQSTKGHFVQAIIAIFIAGILDGMDGRLARAFNAQSKFGEQFDSLADLVSFGVAPAILVYSWSLHPLGRFGIGCAVILAVCAAYRLARFNVQVGEVDSRYFVGVSSPIAAALVASAVWVAMDYPAQFSPSFFSTQIIFATLAASVGFLMISNIRYWSFKHLDKKKVPFALMLPVLLVLLIIAHDFAMGVLGVCASYVGVGLLAAIYRRIRFSSQKT